jgi:hypothetical protein
MWKPMTPSMKKTKLIKPSIKTLDKILSKAEMSPDLRNAIIELKEALRKKDIIRAYEVSAVKSYICTRMGIEKRKQCHFTENGEYNSKVLGMGERDVYGILDNIHFDLAMKAGKIPAGMMVFSAGGIQQKGMPMGKSKTLELIRKEHERIHREVGLKKVV